MEKLIKELVTGLKTSSLQQSLKLAIQINSPLEIINAFEAQKSSSQSQKDGIFYTPQSIVRKMVADCLNPLISQMDLEQLLELKILDPACGGGVFLIECFEFILVRLQSLNADSFSNRVQILNRCICGLDIDPQAIELCKTLLISRALTHHEANLLETDLLNISPRLFHTNSLFDIEDFKSKQDFSNAPLISLRHEFPEIFQRNPAGFDLIIGNPPYGLARDEKISLQENQLLKKRYQKYNIGKVNKYLAFMAKSYEILRDQGCLSFIVPNAWLGIKAGSGLRKIFLQDGSFEAIDIFEKKVFTKLGVETLIFRCRKKAALSKIKLNRYADSSALDLLSSQDIPSDYCLHSAEFIIPTMWEDKTSQMRSYFNANCYRLGSAGSAFTPLIAMQAYAVGKGTPAQTKEQVKNHAFHGASNGKDKHKYLEGRDIRRYGTTWSGKYLSYGPWLAEFQPLARYQGARIVVREILNNDQYKLNACLLKETFLYNKSVLNILAKPSTSEDQLWALLGILNSSLAGYIINNFGRKSQRKLFPKLVNADIKDFPLPNNFNEQVSLLAALTKNICKIPDAPLQVKKLQLELDEAVLKAYGLGSDFTLGSNKIQLCCANV